MAWVFVQVPAASGLTLWPVQRAMPRPATRQTIPHSAPRVPAKWQLAPSEADWFGRSSEHICDQLRDPARNGGRDYAALAKHLGHDVVLQWAWHPGPGREPAPYSPGGAYDGYAYLGCCRTALSAGLSLKNWCSQLSKTAESMHPSPV